DREDGHRLSGSGVAGLLVPGDLGEDPGDDEIVGTELEGDQRQPEQSCPARGRGSVHTSHASDARSLTLASRSSPTAEGRPCQPMRIDSSISSTWPSSRSRVRCNRSRSSDRKSTRLNSSHVSISYAVF